MNDRFDEFYKHLFMVSNLVKDINIDMIMIHNITASAFLSEDYNEIQQYHIQINELESDILNKLTMVEERFLGDVSKVIQLRELFFASMENHNTVMNLLVAGEVDEARDLEESENYNNEGPKNVLMDELILAAQYKAETLKSQAEESYNLQRTGFLLIFFLSVGLMIIISVILTRNISKPIRELAKAAAKADILEADIVLDTDRKDEMGQVAAAFRDMIERLGKSQKEKTEALEKNFQDLFRNMPIGAVMISETPESGISIDRANDLFFKIFRLDYEYMQSENTKQKHDVPRTLLDELLPLSSVKFIKK
jgi:methyl-accepting chemotaxis protein